MGIRELFGFGKADIPARGSPEDLANMEKERAERRAIAMNTGISKEAVAAAHERAVKTLRESIERTTPRREVKEAVSAEEVAKLGAPIETEAQAFDRLAMELQTLATDNGRSKEVESRLSEIRRQSNIKVALAHLQTAIITEGTLTHQRMGREAKERHAQRLKQVRSELK